MNEPVMDFVTTVGSATAAYARLVNIGAPSSGEELRPTRSRPTGGALKADFHTVCLICGSQ